MGRAARLKAKQTARPTTSPGASDAYSRAVEALTSGNRPAAIVHLRQALLEAPGSVKAHFAMAMALREQGSLAEATTHYEAVITLDPRHVDAMTNLGETFRRLHRLPEALAACERALSLDPRHAEAYLIRGVTRHDHRDIEGAIADLQRAAGDQAIAPNALKILAKILMGADRNEEALSILRRACDMPPADAELFRFVGDLCDKLGRLGDAFVAYRSSMEIDAHCAFTYANLSGLLCKTKMLDIALSVTDVGIKLSPDLSGLHYNRAVALEKLDRIDEALLAYTEALRCEPGSGRALMSVCRLRGQICDWDGLAASQGLARTLTYKQGQPIAPFAILPMTSSLSEILACNQAWSRSIDPRTPGLASHAPRPADRRHERLRIGYLSADFHLHATAALIAELFELRDTERFEVFGYSIGAHDEGPMRKRLVAALDHFHDLTDLSHDEAAARIRQDEIDILVDLKGYTFQARAEILARRPAPIQVNYLGYPSTMGARFIDYIIGDPLVTPFEHGPFYAETIVQLPHSYQPNDRKRFIAPDRPTRADCGLPDDAFVFCCFNANYKVTPAIFDIWMRLLRDVPRSVLWLYEAHASASGNLRREADARGIDPARLVFAGKLGVPQHLARMTLGDLFLDTCPVGAHTTASEALWVGLPILTYCGAGFVTRVGASLLSAMGLPELIAWTLEDYEAIARRLATEPDELLAIKTRLAAAIPTAPLFDTPRYARNLEAAFAEMASIRDAGEAPRPFRVVEPT